MLGSLLLLTLVSVTLGRWVLLLLPLTWAAGAAVLRTRVGEQMTLRAACGFHPPSPAQTVAADRMLAGPAVAEFLALQQGEWMAGGVLGVVRVTAGVGPLANAAISRRSEHAADRFAADHGLAGGLAAALQELD